MQSINIKIKKRKIKIKIVTANNKVIKLNQPITSNSITTSDLSYALTLANILCKGGK